MTIPIANPQISDAATEAVTAVLESGDLADGEVVREFERTFADYIGVDHAIATSSGTTALHAMFVASGIGDGDTVLTTPFSFIATANTIHHAGAEPVFADVDPDTYNLDPARVRAVLQDRDVDAIMPVHLYGLPADMAAFRDIADEHDCLLFEDAAQAHGATVEGAKVGSLSNAAAFSFYPTKNMTTGEGGMIVTDDDEIAAEARSFINHGRSGTEKYSHSSIGHNFRMTNLQAAIGQDQLDRLDDWNQERRRHAEAYTDAFESLESLNVPVVPGDRTHVYHQYTLRTEQRDAICAALEQHEIGYGIYYPTTIPDQPAYNTRTDFPVASAVADAVLSIPVHQHLTAADRNTIIEVLTNMQIENDE